MTTSASQSWPQRHQFTAEEYNWMAEVGLLSGESPVELIEGEIIHMPPSGTQHRNVVERLHAALESALASRAAIAIRRVVRLGNITEAQPDLIVTRPERNSHSLGFATGNDTLLVIEVSDTTLLYDHDIKAPVYAAHGIPEVWIVDLQSHRVHFFRSPVDGRYTEIQVCGELGLTKLADFSDSDIDLSGLPL